MNLKKYLFPALFVFLTVSFSQAQEKIAPAPIDVSISVKETKVSFYAKSIIAELKITNNLPAAVDTKQFGFVTVNLSTDLIEESGESKKAFFYLESKIISAGESFVTQIDLDKLDWQGNISWTDINPEKQRAWRDRSKNTSDADTKKDSRPILIGTYFLSVGFGNCEKISPRNPLSRDESKLSISNGKICKSNNILMDFLSPARSR